MWSGRCRALCWRTCDPAGCPPACHQVEYHLHDTASLQPGDPNGCVSDVTLQLALNADSTEEALAFSVTTLVANLGGALGLVLGFSLLSALELLESGVGAVSRRLRATPTKPAPPGTGADRDGRGPRPPQAGGWIG